jgi:matrixin
LPKFLNKLAATASVLTMTASAVAASGSAPAFARSARPSAPPSFCAGTGPIPTTEITAPIDLGTCPIQGRQIVLPLADGVMVAGVNVPPSGDTEGNATTGTNGEYELVAKNVNGFVTVTQSVTPLTPAPPGVTPNTDAACSEGAYNYEGSYWYSANAYPTLGWWYNSSTASRAGLSASATLSDIRNGNNNMSTGQNNCGYSTGAFLVQGAYRGDTSLYANVDSTTHCTNNFPNGQNTVSFGTIDSAHFNQSTHTGTIGSTCWIGSNNHMIETDIYLGSNVRLADTVDPANCNYAQDLQTLATHEWGHAFGLAHVTNSADSAEVMYPTRGWCELRRHLGEGDYNGMLALY